MNIYFWNLHNISSTIYKYECSFYICIQMFKSLTILGTCARMI